MTRTMLITGPTGTVSTALVDTLAAADVSLRVMVRDLSRVGGLRFG